MSALLTTQEYVSAEYLELYADGEPLALDCGKSLSNITVAFETYGTLNDEGTNAILICHALTANAHAAGFHSAEETTPGWWDGLIGEGKAFDTAKYFVVCSNILGSCYGTTGPVSLNPGTGKQYRLSFPQITVRDMVRVQKKLLDNLGVQKLVSVCGSSLGGMQVLEWGIMFPGFCETIIPISVSSKQTTWCLALNAAVRAAITGDPEWRNGNYINQPASGLTIARMLGMISYRSAEELEQRFGRKLQYETSRYDWNNCFQVESYLRHQGEKLVNRFDANSYLYLSRAMDLHDVSFERGSVKDALGGITVPALCIGVSSDIRYPVSDQFELARLIPDATYREINSIHGHDAFLIEFNKLTNIIKRFLEKE